MPLMMTLSQIHSFFLFIFVLHIALNESSHKDVALNLFYIACTALFRSLTT